MNTFYLTPKNKRGHFGHIIVFLLLSILLIFSKHYNLGIFFDEGTFIYRSWRIIEGDVLYKNLGDIRPPGHYFYFVIPSMVFSYILGFSPEDTIIFTREVLSILEILGFYIIYRILTEIQEVNRFTSLLLLASVMLSPLVVGWSTYIITENIAILPFFTSIYFYLKKHEKLEYYFLIGLTMGLSLLIRHVLIVLYLPILVLLLNEFLRNYKRSKQLKLFVVGFILSILPIIVYLIVNNAFLNFIENVVLGFSKNKGWFTPPDLDYKWRMYLKEEFLYDPAIVFLLVLGISTFAKNNKLQSNRIINLIFGFGLIYWISMFLFASYNTKYILPVIYYLPLVCGSFLKNLPKKYLAIFLLILISLFGYQSYLIFTSNYLKDPIHNNNYISPTLQDQVNMANEVRKYNVSDREWFISHQIVVSYLAQIDSYNHINIISDYAFPPKEKLLPILQEKVKLIVLDPATKYHLKSKKWVKGVLDYINHNYKLCSEIPIHKHAISNKMVDVLFLVKKDDPYICYLHSVKAN